MDMRAHRAALAGLLLSPLLTVLLPVAPATALSCVGPERVLADATEVFAGRIVDAADGSVLIAVDEVWLGGSVEQLVWFPVDLEERTAWAGADGTVPDGYASPERWVFAPLGGSVGPCTAWPAEQVAAARPATVASPVAGTDQSDEDAPARREAAAPEVPGTVLAAAGGFAAVAAAAVLLLRRRRPSR